MYKIIMNHVKLTVKKQAAQLLQALECKIAPTEWIQQLFEKS